MQVRGDGKRWDLVFAVPVNEKGDTEDIPGLCDPPDRKNKKIYINPSVASSDKDLMDTVLHEILHATVWSLDEDYVEAYATEAARILYALGYRRTGK